MLLKVCGLRERENVAAIAAIKPQWMGFIFSPVSPRYYNDASEPASIASIPKGIYKTGVFVNADEEKVMNLHNQHQLDYIQLHGYESVEFCKNLSSKGIKIIKAFALTPEFDFSMTEDYAPYASLFLFDSAGKLLGGNGVQFNHALLKGKRFSKPFLLSGGIGPDDVPALKNLHHPDMIGVDVNSRFEDAPGLKNVSALELFSQQIK
jgi:phosphoribosylanthranilate isomerase